jgi:hypothetical protein
MNNFDKMVCVDNLYFEDELTIGKCYDVNAVPTNNKWIAIINDIREEKCYNIRSFLTIHEFRKETLKILIE